MIASVRGTVAHVGLDRVVVEVGGVGMLLHTTPATASSVRAGQEASLSTTLVVREDSLTLFGFATDDERDMFEQVQTVSGVGPRLALAMLAVLPPDRLRSALTGSDLATLTKVPGIGRKGAERMVLELRDKIAPPAGGTDARPPTTTADAWRGQVVDALVGLGWSTKQAEGAVTSVAETHPDAARPDANVSTLLRAALRELGR